MITDLEFDTIRPYTGNEITAATERLSNSEEFLAVKNYCISPEYTHS